MCGILFVSGSDDSTKSTNELCKQLQLIKHRGPDHVSYEKVGKHWIGHVRLALNGINENVSQPFHYKSLSGKDVYLAVNGEIYNHKLIRSDNKFEYKYKTESDCEVIIPLYLKYGESFTYKLNGMFSFSLYDEKKQRLWIARDRLGIKPLYYSIEDGDFSFSSYTELLKKIGHDKISRCLPTH